MEDQSKIDELSKKVERLMQQNKFAFNEILQLQLAINDLKAKQAKPEQNPVKEALPPEPIDKPIQREEIKPQVKTPSFENYREPLPTFAPASPKAPTSPSAIEEFIGTNLLNKVGIAILVIGIGFGVKYAIDHELLSPLTRVILGYVASTSLILVAIWLKKKYENFSAVLLSGGMAALYLVTYAGYAFFDEPVIGKEVAFVMMVLFTVFTCFAAIQYNLQMIAIIGLVGAYAVPFLLSDGSGQVSVLFTYIAIINTGILVLAFKRNWNLLYYLAFLMTWIIFASWFGMRYNAEEHLWLSLTFSTIFFVIFYTTFLSYKLIRKEPLARLDIVMLMMNSFTYFGYGYAAIDSAKDGDGYLGIFTVFMAVLHFIGAVIIYKQQTQHKDVFYLIAGMVLTFLTLAVPIQLDGNWVTLVWASEAFLLFWIGRTKTFPVYEKLSYGLIALAFGSLVHDWDSYYGIYEFHTTNIPLFINIQFFTSLWVAASFALILMLGLKSSYKNPFDEGSLWKGVFSYGLPALLGLVIYFAFFKEIQTYWDQRYNASFVEIKSQDGGYNLYNEDLTKFQAIWLINYSAIFAFVLSVINARFIKNQAVAYVCVALNALVITAFLFNALLAFSELRASYLEQTNASYFTRGIYHIGIRYIGILFIAPLIYLNYWYVNKTEFFKDEIRKMERVLFHLVMLTLLSSELVHILNMLSIHDSFKLALSILWGMYALLLIILGLWKDQKHIRITAIVLFGITLAKLFLYDMADMGTIAKTVVMMILGVLLLIASFLYNKYKKSNENI
jgi:uncharacterized membrane protein